MDKSMSSFVRNIDMPKKSHVYAKKFKIFETWIYSTAQRKPTFLAQKFI